MTINKLVAFSFLLASVLGNAQTVESSRPGKAPLGYKVDTKHSESLIDHFKLIFDLPTIQGSQALSRVVESSMRRLRESEISDLKKFCLEPCEGEQRVTFEVAYSDMHFLSVEIYSFSYAKGAAHPSHQIESYTWTVQEPRSLALQDLFTDRERFLLSISDKVRVELSKKKESAYFSSPDLVAEGTEPKIENYRVWTISDMGLRIIFNEYQVAAYVAGPQEVLLSWPEIKSIIDPAGPLACLVK